MMKRLSFTGFLLAATALGFPSFHAEAEPLRTETLIPPMTGHIRTDTDPFEIRSFVHSTRRLPRRARIRRRRARAANPAGLSPVGGAGVGSMGPDVNGDGVTPSSGRGSRAAAPTKGGVAAPPADVSTPPAETTTPPPADTTAPPVDTTAPAVDTTAPPAQPVLPAR